MSEVYNDEEMLSLENDFEVGVQTLDDLDRRISRVASFNAVDRMTMEAIQAAYPETVDDNFPLASFTKDPSDQNLLASMESFAMAKKIAIAAVGALLGSVLFMLVKLFRTDGAEARAQKVDKQVSDIREKDKTIEKMIKEAQEANLDAKDKILLKAIESNNYLDYAQDLNLSKASSQGKIYLDAVSQNGDIFRLLEKWSRSIHNHYTSFGARVNTLTDMIGTMYDLDAKNVDKFIKDLDAATLDKDDPFFEDMADINDTMQNFLRGANGEYSTFLASSVFNTREFYDLALTDDRWMDRVSKLSPSGEKQLEKNLDRIEKDAQALIEGKRDATLSAKIAKRRHRLDEDGNLELDAITSNLNVERAVKNAELAIRMEVQYLRVYRISLGRVLYFYQMTSLKTLEMNNLRTKLLREMLNRATVG